MKYKIQPFGCLSHSIIVYTNCNFYVCFAVSLLKDLKHANIVTLHDIVHTPKSLTLVFEYLVSNIAYLSLLPYYNRFY